MYAFRISLCYWGLILANQALIEDKIAVGRRELRRYFPSG